MCVYFQTSLFDSLVQGVSETVYTVDGTRCNVTGVGTIIVKGSKDEHGHLEECSVNPKGEEESDIH